MSKRRLTLVDLVTQEHLQLYKDRKILAKDLATIYGVNPNYIYQAIKREPAPVKPPSPTKSELTKARREYRLKLSLTTSARIAAETTYTSLRTMYRYKALAKKLQTT